LGAAPLFGPLKSGYDEFFGLMGGAMDYYTHDLGTLAGPPRTPDLYENETPIIREGYATDLFTARAIAFIESNRTRPFFLSLHYTAPHWPWQSRTDPGARRANDFHFDGGSPAIYTAMIAALDEGVGAVLAALDTHGLSENTLVVFTSDNGGERFSYQWPLRGEKTTLYEGGIRVPTLVRWPGRLPAGATPDGVNITMDWLPTLLRAASAQPHPRYRSDGVDILPMLTGAAPPERTLYWRAVDQAAALRGRWKYLRLGELEYLYDLGTDPNERANLRVRQADIFAALRHAHQSWAAGMLPIPDDARIDPAVLQRLEALRGPN
jgi:arylsulfatase A-like enzyme